MDHADDPQLREALDKQALHDLTMLYCRAVDRHDIALLPQVFHDDAEIQHGDFTGTPDAFAQHVPALFGGAECTYHCVGNSLFRIDGDRAWGELYALIYFSRREDGALLDSLLGSRFVDQYARRDGQWKIARRQLVMDWNQNQPSSAEWEAGMYGQLRARGRRGPDDPVYGMDA